MTRTNYRNCDKCGVLLNFEKETKYRMRIEGITPEGIFDEVKKDLCPECREYILSSFDQVITH
jgi:hypothetical protein